jgi:osmotically-inducible protein OsmY
MRADSDIRRDVELEIRYDPVIRSSDIGVSVRNRIVTLTGFARSYTERFQAERDAKRVAGVAAIANELEVRLPSADRRPDSDLAQDIVLALASQVPYLSGVTPIVHNGEVTLEGEVEWRFQKEQAEEVVRRLRGVRLVTNLIRVKDRSVAEDIQAQIRQALARNAALEATKIVVETEGGKVILKGLVHSLAEKEEAERAAWQAPGVITVDNRLLVGDPALIP